MAIIQVDRPRLLGGQYLQQNLKTKFPATSSAVTYYPGDQLTMSSGYAVVNNTASDTATSSAGGCGIMGICEQLLSGHAQGDPVAATILMPHILYEANILSTVTLAHTAFIGGMIAPQSIVAYTGTNIGVTGVLRGFALASVTNAVGGGGPYQVIAFKAFQDQYITHTVFQAAGTAVTTGATHVPSFDAGASSGDQNPRVIFTPNPGFTIWGQNWGTASNAVINHY